MSASLARTVFRPVISSQATTARYFVSQATRSQGQRQEHEQQTNLMAHLAVLATLLASTHYYLSHPDALMFDHPPRSAINWVPSKHIAHRQLSVASPSSSSSLASPSSPFTSTRSTPSPRPPPSLNAPLFTPIPSTFLTPFDNLGKFLAGFRVRD